MPEQPSYVTYYGLKNDPFGGLVEHPFVAVSDRQQVVDTLLHLLSYTEDIVFVAGPAGSGKTAVLEQLIRQLHENLDLVMVDVASISSDKELLWDLATQFHLHPDRSHSTQRLQLMLQAHCQSLQDQGKVPTLVVDDIDELPVDVLAGLSPVLHGGLDNTAGLRLVGLASDPGEIRRELSALGFASAQMIELAPLTLPECVNLLQAYFVRGGLDTGIPLDGNTLKRLHRQSQGRPGPFLDGVRDTLLVESQRRRRRSVVPWPHMVAGAAIIAVLALAALYQGGSDPEPQELVDPTAEMEMDADPEPTDETQSGIDQALAEDTAETVRQRLEEAMRGGPEGSAPEQAPESAPQGTEGAAIPPELLADLEESAPEPTPEPEPEPEPAPAASGHPLASPDWLRAADSGHFTIQLLGAREQDNIINFAQQHDLTPDNAALVRTELDGSPWYVLVTGSYPDREAARAAIEALPSDLQALTPWPRTLGALQGGS